MKLLITFLILLSANSWAGEMECTAMRDHLNQPINFTMDWDSATDSFALNFDQPISWIEDAQSFDLVFSDFDTIIAHALNIELPQMVVIKFESYENGYRVGTLKAGDRLIKGQLGKYLAYSITCSYN